MSEADLTLAKEKAEVAASAAGHLLAPWQPLAASAVVAECRNLDCVLEARVWAMDAARPRRYVACPLTAAMRDALIEGNWT